MLLLVGKDVVMFGCVLLSKFISSVCGAIVYDDDFERSEGLGKQTVNTATKKAAAIVYGYDNGN